MIDSFSPSNLKKNELSMFVCASFGKGEPTDNARKFNAFLSGPDEAVSAAVDKVPFAVFGLGMSCTYPENYQAFPRFIESRMASHGAIQIVSRGEGDDSKDIEEDFQAWYDTVFKPCFDQPVGTHVESVQPVEHQTVTCPNTKLLSHVTPLPDPKILVSDAEQAVGASPAAAAPTKSPHFNWDYPFMAPVKGVRTLTAPDHIMRKALHVDFDFSDAPEDTMEYESGDYLAILPSNLRMVDSVIKLLQWTGEEQLSSADFPGIPRLPPTFTSRDALTHYFDIRNPPKRAVIRTLSEFAKNPFERRTLMHLGATTDDSASSSFYQQYILRDNRGIGTILRDFPSIRIAPKTLIERLGPIKPRLYSIANSGSQSGQSASICMTVLFGPAPDGRPWHGTNSYYMSKVAVGDRIPMYIQHSSIRLPKSADTPLIMVGVGTGISLFRSFWQARTEAKSAAPNLFFFGCNGRTDDLYSDELAELKHITVHRSYAFDPVEPTFIQYRFAQNGRQVVELLLHEGAHMYICGHKALGVGIRDTLLTLFRRYGSMHYREAIDYLAFLQAENRYVEEIFQ